MFSASIIRLTYGRLLKNTYTRFHDEMLVSDGLARQGLVVFWFLVDGLAAAAAHTSAIEAMIPTRSISLGKARLSKGTRLLWRNASIRLSCPISHEHSVSLQARPVHLNRLQVAGAAEVLLDLGLFDQHGAVRLAAQLGKLAPAGKVLGVALVAVGVDALLPVTLGEADHGGDALLLDVVDHADERARLLEPAALPELAGAHALVRHGLVVQAARHGTAVDGVHDPVLVEEPHLVPPRLVLARLSLVARHRV